MLFEIVNPSDPATLEADDFEIASVANLVLGEGFYGLKECGGTREMPTLAFWGSKADGWFREQFGRTSGQSVEFCATSKRPALIACFESVVLGNAGDRECYQAALNAIPDEWKRVQFRATWHDKHRSSVNDIYKAAMGIAGQLKGEAEPQEGEGCNV